MPRGEEAVRVLVFWATVSAAEGRALAAHGVCCAAVYGTALTVPRAVMNVFPSCLYSAPLFHFAAGFSSCADPLPKVMC